MRRIPWRLSLRYSRKGAITVLGIALAVAFALVSFSVATALERETVGMARNHPERALVASLPGGAPFPFERVSSLPGIVGVATFDAVDDSGTPRVAVALLGEGVPSIPPGTARPAGIATSGRLVVSGELLSLGEPVSHAVLRPGWYLVPGPEDLREVHFVVATGASTAVARALVDAGLVVEGAPALEDFFRVSAIEIARDLLLVVFFTSALSALFSYELLRSEMYERRREIGIWRAVGMRANDVLLLLLARAGAVAILTLAIGWAIAWLLMEVARQRTGSGALAFALSATDATLVSAAFVSATILGALVPALMARRLTIRATMEATV